MTNEEQGAAAGDVLDLKGTDEAEAAARARALSSPVRWRILRLCLHVPRTNKELAGMLGVNPGSMLHHVRTLVSTGYLEAQEARRGARNAVEIPYLASQLTWQAALGASQFNSIMMQVLEQEAEGVAPEDVRVWRTSVHLDEPLREEFEQRLGALVDEFRDRGAADNGGRAWSMTAFLLPDGDRPA